MLSARPAGLSAGTSRRLLRSIGEKRGQADKAKEERWGEESRQYIRIG